MAISPWALATNGSEHAEQSALFCWLSIAERFGIQCANEPACYTVKGAADAFRPSVAIPELKWVFAIPNGGSRGDSKSSAMMQGALMKAEGVKSGVSDIFVPIARHGLHGLFIEMKRADGGTLSAQQIAFGAAMKGQGYGFVCCHGWIEAANCIIAWLYGMDYAHKLA